MLGIVLVNYKNNEEVIGFVQDELCLVKQNKIIVIVDNSNDKIFFRGLVHGLNMVPFEERRETVFNRDNIFLIDACANLGFAKANNLGVQFFNEFFTGIKYVLFSNTDISLKGKDVVSELILAFQRNENIGAVGPKIVGLDNELQSPHRYISFNERYIYSFVLKYIIPSLKRKCTFSDLVENPEEGFVYRLMGSFLLIDKAVFNRVGGFDSKTFMYCEEKILAERLKKINKFSYYFPNVEVLHYESQTTSKAYNQRKKMRLILKSDLYYYSKYKNNSYLLMYILGNISLMFRFLVLKIKSILDKI